MKKIMQWILFLLLVLCQKVYATAAAIDFVNIEPILASCNVTTSSELELANLQLKVPYIQYNGTYFDTTFNYVGSTNGQLTWQLIAAEVESPSLPSGCVAKAIIIDQAVLLEEIQVKNSDVVYTATFNLEVASSGIFLKLIEYKIFDNGSGSSNGSDSGDTVNLNSAGSSDELKLVLAVASSDSSMTLAWTSYSSSNTNSSNMNYQVHLSSQEGFSPDSSTLYTSLQGQAQTELSGLSAGTQYFIKIVAEDSSGQSVTSNALSASTFSSPVVINSSVAFENTDNLQLGTAAVNGNQLTFNTSSSSLPAVNSLLAGETEEGGFLRWVDSVSQSGNTVQINTRDASLNEIVSTGHLSSEVLLQDISHTSRRQWDNSRVSQISWNDDLLVINQVQHSTRDDDVQITPLGAQQRYRVKVFPEGRLGNKRASNSLTVDAEVTFNPTLTTDMDWSFFSGLNSASVKTTGSLGIEVKASYDFDGSTEYNPDPKRLLTKTFKAKYFIGSVPVWQVTTVTLDIQISASASSEIKASSTANASATFGFGSQYNGSSWSSYSNPVSTSQSLTADISVNGKVQGEIRLIPNIKTTFYQAVAGNISVEPFINGELAAEFLSNSDLLAGLSINYVQPTDFNVDLGLECYMSVELSKIFNSISVLEKTKVCGGEDTLTGKISYPLFSLPELTLVQNSSSEGTYSFTGTAKNGTNNNFDSSSVQWFVSPEGPSLSINHSNGSEFSSTMTFTPETGVEKYVVFFSGNGVLGEVGRQYQQIEIGAAQSCDALSGSWNTSGSTTVTSSVSGVDDTQSITSSASGTANISISGAAATISFNTGSVITGTCAADGLSIVLDPPDSSQLQGELLAGGIPVTSVTSFESATITVTGDNNMSLLGPGSVQINTSVGTFILRHTYNISFTR